MTVHVNDVGTQVSQGVIGLNVLDATVTLRVQRPDRTVTSVTGTVTAADRVEAVVGSGVWTAPGTYQLQFQIVLGSSSFALDRASVQVMPRL